MTLFIDDLMIFLFIYSQMLISVKTIDYMNRHFNHGISEKHKE